MLFLCLSIFLSVLLLLNFRVFPRYDVNTFQAIVFNYLVCFLTGWLLLPAGQSFTVDFSQTWTWMALGLGVGFILTFLLSGASTQRMGITATSLANNLSLVIPVCFSLFVFRTGGKVFDALNYMGLVLAVVAVGLSTYRKSPEAPATTDTTPRRVGADVLLPVGVFLFYGATNTMINYMNIHYIPSADKTIQVTLTMVLGAVVAGLVMLAVRLIQGKETIQGRNLIAAFTLGIPNFLSFYTLLLALSAFGSNGAFVYPLYNIGVILLAALLAALFFREPLSTANKVGLALAIVAIGLISWQELVATTPSARRDAVPRATDHPNIIFIFSDDHTHQAISAYGSKLAKTPNIDRIANEGAILHTNIVTNSICGPSRATLLTGQFSHVNGYKLNEKVFDVRQSVFPQELQKNGYQTAWIGKLHLGALPHGFDYLNVLPGHGHYYNSNFVNSKGDTTQYPGYVTNVITKLSLDWLTKRDASKPFFLVVGHKATHREWLPDIPDLGAYDSRTFPLPTTFYDDYKGRLAAQDQDMTIDKTMRLKEDLKVHADYDSKEPFNGYGRFTPEQKKPFYDYYENKISKEFDAKKLSGKALVEWKYQRYLKDYLSVANSLDRNIGELLNYLDKTGLAKNTVVIYASDQGFYMGEHGWFDKRWIYEESLKTPFVIRYPGVIKPHTHINQLISNIDWAPTLLSLTGTAIPNYIQGESFLPLLKGEKTNWRNEAYYHYYEFPQPHHVSPHLGIRTEQYTLARFYGPKDFWELYDIKKDPHNLHNLYGQKGYEAVTADLKMKLKAQIRNYKDDEALKLVE